MTQWKVLEGFDDGYWSSRWTTTGTVDAAYGRHGNGIRIGDNHSADFGLGVTGTYYTMGFAFNIQSEADTAARFVEIRNFRYYIDLNASTHSITHRNTQSGTNISGPDVWAHDTWHYLEWHIRFTNSPDGYYLVKLDGTTLFSDTGIDTLYSADYPNTFSIGAGINSMWMDDLYLYIDDTTAQPLGDTWVDLLFPDGNGNASNFTGSDADKTNNYLLVNDQSDLTYVEDNTQGTIDTYTMDDLAGTPEISTMFTTHRVQMDGTGPKAFRPIVRSNGTDYEGTSKGLMNGTYANVDEEFRYDPDTALPWVYTDLNAVEIGQEVMDST